MADNRQLRELIERIVAESLANRLSGLQAEIAESACRAAEDLLAQAPPAVVAPAPAGAPTELLNAALGNVLDCHSQAEILDSLLDGMMRFSGRCALFVIRGGSAVGWRARGFDENEAIKAISFAPDSGLAGRAYDSRQPAQAAAAEFDPGFISRFGKPLPGSSAVVLPLLLHDKVAALLYADGGDSESIDRSALECLTRATSLWLEIVAARKSASSAPVEAPPEPERTGTQEFEAVPEPGEPETTTVPESPVPHAWEPAAAASPEPAPAPVSAVASGWSAPSAAVPLPTPSEPEEELHRRAKRFAKLLVEEIMLYNQQNVAEGRANRDLYARLRDDIEKSRATFERRYGQTPAGPANYFHQELVRILCDGDASLLGGNFSG